MFTGGSTMDVKQARIVTKIKRANSIYNEKMGNKTST